MCVCVCSCVRECVRACARVCVWVGGCFCCCLFLFLFFCCCGRGPGFLLATCAMRFLGTFCARVLSWFGVAETFTPSGDSGNVISGHVHERGPGVSACQGSFLLMACDVNSGHVHDCRPQGFGCLVFVFCVRFLLLFFPLGIC